MSRTLKVRKCPTDDLADTNCAVVRSDEFNASRIKHVLVKTGPGHHYTFSIKNHPDVRQGEIAFAMPQRKWASLSLDQEVSVEPFAYAQNQMIAVITLSVDFQSKKSQTSEPLNSDHMAREFSMQFSQQAFTKDELLVMRFTDEKQKSMLLSLKVKEIQGIDIVAAANVETARNAKPFPLQSGQLLPNSSIIFDKEEGSTINLIGKSKGKSAYRSIINPDWDFQKMGIGGLDKEFSDVFRRAFASRVFPPEFIEQLAMKHVRGILLFGPPGTGKTLMARQIAKMLNAREPKIVNGPQILDKYVGESEANIRKLFAEAEEEWKRCGANSGLHIIVFDEIDAICKQRGSMAGASGVHDTVVNQLLSKMDGVDQLNNVLVIGMTNRKDMIDDALLRPGRFEVHLEIPLPNEAGRAQILRIHTARMMEYDKLDPSVNLEDLSRRTKNFSGAEIEGLVRAAQSRAMNRLVKVGGKTMLQEDAIEKLKITQEDFDLALENDVKAAFGRSEEALEHFLRGNFVIWGPEVSSILDQGALLVEQVRDPESQGFASAVLLGAPFAGKSYLAARIAKDSEFPFVRVVDPADMVGFSEAAKCAALKKAYDDALRSPLSVLFIDDVEALLDYSPIGPRYSNLVLQALRVLLRRQPPLNRRLLVLATCASRNFFREFELDRAFMKVIDVPRLSTTAHLVSVFDQAASLNETELAAIEVKIKQLTVLPGYGIGIKQLLSLIDFTRRCEPEFKVATLHAELEKIALGLDR